jgi:hypothetical protein
MTCPHPYRCFNGACYRSPPNDQDAAQPDGAVGLGQAAKAFVDARVAEDAATPREYDGREGPSETAANDVDARPTMSEVGATIDATMEPATPAMDAGLARPDTERGCVPVAEQCWNGMDDDCDGQPDCADSDCSAGAVCVPEADGFTIGVATEPSDDCPAGYTQSEVVLGSEPAAANTCTGCRCQAGRVMCRPVIRAYTGSADQCLADTANAGGVNITPVPDPNIDKNPLTSARACPWVIDTAGVGTPKDIFGLLLERFDLSAPCTAEGVGRPPALMWGTRTKFCRLSRIGGGCGPGRVCVTKTTKPIVAAKAASVSCPPRYETNRRSLFAGVKDDRTCEVCSCARQGASCENISLLVGSDFGCDGGSVRTLRVGVKDCEGALYSPGLRLSDEPRAGTCQPRSAVRGSLSPSEPHTLCTFDGP